MKILVTGGAGYIGFELVQRLDKLEEVESIIILDNLSRRNYNFFFGNGNRLKKVRFVKGDILDSRQVGKLLEGIDVVYHLAAKVTTPFSDQDPHFFEQVNHWGTADLVFSIENSTVSRLIYVSSTSIYGSSGKEVDEEKSPNPKTFYGISKLRGEEQVQRLFPKLKTYILRCGNVYGYNSSVRFDAVINKFMLEANFYGKIAVYGDGAQTRSFIHVNQIADILEQLSFSDAIPPGIYDAVGNNWSIQHIAETINSIYPKLDIIYVNQHLKLRQLNVKPSDKLRKFINIPEIDLKEALLQFKHHFIY